MSEAPRGDGWWMASDDKWYPPTAMPAPPEPLTAGSVLRRFTHGVGVVLKYLGLVVLIAGAGLFAVALSSDAEGDAAWGVAGAIIIGALAMLVGLFIHAVGMITMWLTSRRPPDNATAAVRLGIIGMAGVALATSGAALPLWWLGLVPDGLALILWIFAVVWFIVGVLICSPIALIRGLVGARRGVPGKRMAKQGAGLGAVAITVAALYILAAAFAAQGPPPPVLLEAARWGLTALGMALIAQVIYDHVSTQHAAGSDLDHDDRLTTPSPRAAPDQAVFDGAKNPGREPAHRGDVQRVRTKPRPPPYPPEPPGSESRYQLRLRKRTPQTTRKRGP